MAADATVWAAWIGAITGIGALLLQAYQHWTRGPDVKMTASTNNLVVEIGQPTDSTLYILVDVTNTGDRKTTLLSFELYIEPFKESRLLEASPVTYIPLQTFGKAQGQGYEALPFALNVGDVWRGKIPQDEEMLRRGKQGNAVVRLSHSASTKPVGVKVKFE